MQKERHRGFEFKYNDAPKLTKSMNIAMQDLHLDDLVIIYPGEKNYQVEEKIFVYGLESYIKGRS